MLDNPLPAAQAAAASTTARRLPQVPLSVDARLVAESPFALLQFGDQVVDVLARGLPLSVAMPGLEQHPARAGLFREVCCAIAAAASRSATPARDIEVVIPAGALTPRAAWTVRCEALGEGPLYLLASERDRRATFVDGPELRQFWSELWQLRGEPNLRLAVSPLVRSHCPLLADERGATVVPRSSIQAPAGSAWVVEPVDLVHFADARGSLDRQALAARLRQGVERGLAAHASTDWPTPGLRHDSWLNRRVAIFVSGIGDLVVRRRQDPRQLACLANLRATLRWIRTTLTAESKRIGLADELLPAISQSNPALSLCSDRERWHARWAAAISEHGGACRNLFVLSPWSVFPARLEPDPAFLNLLPLLDFADACAFPEPLRLTRWNMLEFRQLYQRAAAVLARRGGAHSFAEQV